jgi:glutathione synthase/RimK-type ligase-like ATP-grasp enzyme
MPWSFGNYVQTKDKHIRKKILIRGIEDFLLMTEFLKKNKSKLPEKLISYSNKRIAILIHKKLGFDFIDFKNLQDVIKNCNRDVVRLEITIEKILEQEKNNKKILNRLKLLNFE